MNQSTLTSVRGLFAIALLVAGLAAGPALADDVEVVPAPGDGFVVTDNGGSMARFRVLESGEIYVAGVLVSIEDEDHPLCYDTVTGRIGNCPLAALGTDDQLLDLAANTLNIENGNSVDLSGYLDNTDVLAGLSCADGQVAEYNAGSWGCATPVAAGDNLGNHIATQNIQLGSFYLSSDGGDEGIRVDAAGNVNIGSNANPFLSTLTVTATESSMSVGHNGNFNDPESGRLRFSEDVSFTGGLCGFEFYHDGTTNRLNLDSGCTTLETLMVAERSGAMKFTKRVLVGGDDPDLPVIADLQVKQSSSSTSPESGGLVLEEAANTNRWQLWNASPTLSFAYNGGRVAYVDTAGAFFTVSDGRLKEDVRDLPAGALEGVLQLRPVSYRYTHQEPTAWRSTGLIAQEVQKVFPDLVHTGGDGQLALPYGEIAVVTIQALKEMEAEKNAEIAALTARIEALEKRLGSE